MGNRQGPRCYPGRTPPMERPGAQDSAFGGSGVKDPRQRELTRHSLRPIVEFGSLDVITWGTQVFSRHSELTRATRRS
ncbi:protein of unknown function [Candidatus Methylomirabilis oxygeniifera]|uniref:Uncharacterized protein n=1 Tax=Methylomirabilis oxygeniifera TaxID=671143 RepID=D5ML05_METO1|nr:protein of unknown function [Candidatus Methylomirabilis oxyfera]